MLLCFDKSCYKVNMGNNNHGALLLFRTDKNTHTLNTPVIQTYISLHVITLTSLPIIQIFYSSLNSNKESKGSFEKKKPICLVVLFYLFFQCLPVLLYEDTLCRTIIPDDLL